MRLANVRASWASSSEATSSKRRSSVTEPPNRRSRASWSASRPSRRSRALTPGTSSSIASTSGSAGCRWSKVSTDCWRKRRRTVSAMSCSSSSLTRSTSKRRERSNVVPPRSEEKNTPSSSCEPRGAPPPSSTIRVTRRAKSCRFARRRGSSGSVISAVLSVAKISASGCRSPCAAAAGAATASTVKAMTRVRSIVGSFRVVQATAPERRARARERRLMTVPSGIRSSSAAAASGSSIRSLIERAAGMTAGPSRSRRLRASVAGCLNSCARLPTS